MQFWALRRCMQKEKVVLFFLDFPQALTVSSFFLNFPAAFRPSITNFSASLEDLKRKFPFRL